MAALGMPSRNSVYVLLHGTTTPSCLLASSRLMDCCMINQAVMHDISVYWP
jgi:hypothetical protein